VATSLRNQQIFALFLKHNLQCSQMLVCTHVHARARNHIPLEITKAIHNT